LSEASLAEVCRIARQNAQVYEELFKVLPSNSVRTWSDLADWRAEGHPLRDAMRVPTATEAEQKMSGVQGHLVQYPLDFLLDEDLSFRTAGIPTAVALTPTCWQPDAFN